MSSLVAVETLVEVVVRGGDAATTIVAFEVERCVSISTFAKYPNHLWCGAPRTDALCKYDGSDFMESATR